jgi:hypothetical protein
MKDSLDHFGRLGVDDGGVRKPDTGSQTPTDSPRNPDTHRLTEMASQEVGCLDTLGIL